MILYHGTDARIVSMTERQRESHFCDIEKVIDSIGPLFSQYIYNYDGLKRVFQSCHDDGVTDELFSTLRHINSKNIGSLLYRYDAFYVTNDYSRAVGYARDAFAFGERGKHAYILCKAFEGLKNKPVLALGVSSCLDNVVSFALNDAKPVVFEFENLNKDSLVEENGMTWETIEEQLTIIPQLQLNFRYTKPLTLDLSKAHHINIL